MRLFLFMEDVIQMTAAERLVQNGYENVVVFAGEYTYDSALVGVTEDYRAVYDYDKMVDWLAEKEGVDRITAMDWLESDTLFGIQEMGPDGPIILYPLLD